MLHASCRPPDVVRSKSIKCFGNVKRERNTFYLGPFNQIKIMTIKLRVCWLPLVLLLSCQQNDHTAHPSYPVIEEFLTAQQLYGRFNLQDVSVDRFSLADAQEYRGDSLRQRSLKATYELTLRGEDQQYTATAEVSSPDSTHWTMALFTLSEYGHRGSTDVKTTLKWDMQSSSD